MKTLIIAIIGIVTMMADFGNGAEESAEKVLCKWHGINLVERPSKLYSDMAIKQFLDEVEVPRDKVKDVDRSAGCGIEIAFGSIFEVDPYYIIIHRNTGIYCYVSCPSALMPLAEFLKKNSIRDGDFGLLLKPGMYVNGKFFESDLRHQGK